MVRELCGQSEEHKQQQRSSKRLGKSRVLGVQSVAARAGGLEQWHRKLKGVVTAMAEGPPSLTLLPEVSFSSR